MHTNKKCFFLHPDCAALVNTAHCLPPSGTRISHNKPTCTSPLLYNSHSALIPTTIPPAANPSTATARTLRFGARAPFCTPPPLPPILIPPRSPAMPSGPPPRRARVARLMMRRSWPAKPSVRWGPWAATQVPVLHVATRNKGALVHCASEQIFP